MVTAPYYADASTTVYAGDCLEILPTLADSSVDAVVTDPPYGLEFMGKEWDRLGDIGKVSHAGIPERDGSSVFGRAARVNYNGSSNVRCRNCHKWKWGHTEGDGGGGGKRCHCDEPDFPSPRPDQALIMQQWHYAWAAECLRILKPGGHLLAFGGTRTAHRLACAIEDAGFEIRDSIAWLYGSGFPKSLDVSKAIDKAAGAERGEGVPGPYAGRQPNPGNFGGVGDNWRWGDQWLPWGELPPAALAFYNQPNGLVTAPATPEAEQWQGWGTALKPAHEPIIVARKPLAAGTVAANVLAYGTGALNIDAGRIGTSKETPASSSSTRTGQVGQFNMGGNRDGTSGMDANTGRWPANVALDESQAAALDQMSGDTGAHGPDRGSTDRRSVTVDFGLAQHAENRRQDQGGAARFYFTAKASTDERITHNGVAHPTVKSLSLMRWLVRLVTPPGGTILEPFAGSGTTVEAALLEGFRCIAIEREADYLPLITQRINRRRDPIAYITAAGGDLGLFGEGDGE